MTSAAIAAQRLGGRRTGRSSPGVLTRLRARMPRVRPFKVLTVTVFSAALVGIVANAMVFQRGRHPAPLFGLGQSVDGLPEASQHATAPLPVPPAPAPIERTGTIAPTPPPTADPTPTAVAVAPPPTAPHRAAPKPHRDDGTAAKAKLGADQAAAHPRPGHALPKPVSQADFKPEAKARPKADPVGKLLAEPLHKAKPLGKRVETKTEVGKAEQDRHVKPAAAATAHPRHGLASAEPAADTVRKAATPE